MSYIQDPTAFLGAPNPPAGQYVYPVSENSSTTSVTHGTGSLRLLPWLVSRSLRIDRIGGEVTTIGDVGSKVRLGIYADTGACYPGALLLDGGQIAGDSATVQELTASLSLTPGLYWIGGAVQAVTTTQPTVRAVSAWTPPLLVGGGSTLPSAGAAAIGFLATGVTAALPGTFSASVISTGSCLRPLVRLA